MHEVPKEVPRPVGDVVRAEHNVARPEDRPDAARIPMEPPDAPHVPSPAVMVHEPPAELRGQAARGATATDLASEAALRTEHERELNSQVQILTDQFNAQNKALKNKSGAQARAYKMTVAKTGSDLAEAKIALDSYSAQNKASQAAQAERIAAPPQDRIISEPESSPVRVESQGAASIEAEQPQLDATSRMFAEESRRAELKSRSRSDELSALEMLAEANIGELASLKPGTAAFKEQQMQVEKVNSRLNDAKLIHANLDGDTLGVERQIRELGAQAEIHEDTKPQRIADLDQKLRDLNSEVTDLSGKVGQGEGFWNWVRQLFGGGISPSQHAKNQGDLDTAIKNLVENQLKRIDIDMEPPPKQEELKRLHESLQRLQSNDPRIAASELREIASARDAIQAENAAKEKRIKQWQKDIYSPDPKIRERAQRIFEMGGGGALLAKIKQEKLANRKA